MVVWWFGVLVVGVVFWCFGVLVFWCWGGGGVGVLVFWCFFSSSLLSPLSPLSLFSLPLFSLFLFSPLSLSSLFSFSLSSLFDAQGRGEGLLLEAVARRPPAASAATRGGRHSLPPRTRAGRYVSTSVISSSFPPKPRLPASSLQLPACRIGVGTNSQDWW